MDANQNYFRYREARKIFAIKTYLLLFVWLILALAQWCIINFVESGRSMFIEYYYIGFITFFLSVLIFAIFIFFEKLRFIKGLNFIISLIIVELQIISVFTLVAKCHWMDLLLFYALCFVILWLFILIGTFLPKKIDFTLDVAVLFIVGFLFLIIAVYFLIIRFFIIKEQDYTYVLAEVAINIIIVFFVMYHAQTIHGSRYAEMRLNDALLGSLILFHDFLIIYWLTFYWQLLVKPLAPEAEVLLTSVNPRSSTRRTTAFEDTGGNRMLIGFGEEGDEGAKDKDDVKEGDTVKFRGREPPRAAGVVDAAVNHTIDAGEDRGHKRAEDSLGVNRMEPTEKKVTRFSAGSFEGEDKLNENSEEAEEDDVLSVDNDGSVRNGTDAAEP